jgi:hypothetical protein
VVQDPGDVPGVVDDQALSDEVVGTLDGDIVGVRLAQRLDGLDRLAAELPVLEPGHQVARPQVIHFGPLAAGGQERVIAGRLQLGRRGDDPVGHLPARRGTPHDPAGGGTALIPGPYRVPGGDVDDRLRSGYCQYLAGSCEATIPA